MKNSILLFALFLIFGCRSEERETAAARPNVVFIFADDMTYTAINALGNDNIQTPNLNRLVENGTTFTHAYNMGAWNGAVCVASRAMIISGRSVWDAYKIKDEWEKGEQLDKTWGQLMENAGYDTYMTGKWHVAAPADSVFENVVHVRPGMPGDAWINSGKGANFKYDGPESLPIGYNRPKDKNDTLWSPTDKKFGGFWKGGQHWSEVLRYDALTFIGEATPSENPFFMYLAFNAPHDPRQAPQKYLDLYPLENIDVPESWLPMYPFKDSIGNGPSLRDEALAPFPRTEYAIKKHMQEYYAAISHMDAQIGHILDGLQASGKMDNTYIIFTADHGLAIGRHGLLGKQTQFDHSVRAPFMIMGPDIPQGKKVSEDIYLQDAMATSLDLAGAKKPDYVFFNSVLPLIEGGEGNYPAIYGSYVNSQRMIRKDGFKLIVYPKLSKVLLFDLKNDPEEMNDLAEDPEYQEKADRLFDELLKLQSDLGDPLDISGIRSPSA